MPSVEKSSRLPHSSIAAKVVSEVVGSSDGTIFVWLARKSGLGRGEGWWSRNRRPDVRRCHQMTGHGAKFGRKREEAIAALLSHRSIRRSTTGDQRRGIMALPLP
jgi:hypothetical protein